VCPARSWLTALCALAVLFIAASYALASQPEVHKLAPRAFAEHWTKAFNFALIGVAAGLIVYTIGFRRHRLDEPTSKWLLFLGICVLPAPVMVLSTAVGLEQSKEVQFCASCHVMKPFIDDLKDPGSKSLAALHYKNRYIQREHCYLCHTDYGILGTMEAKMSGLGHIWKETTGTYQLPIKMAKPYSYTICLDCHAESAKFNKQPAHDGVVKETLEGKGKCVDCHDPPHPAPETRSKE
jgi:nitrate/TMAO reductase-like tetraheme cytochrome c subunit